MTRSARYQTVEVELEIAPLKVRTAICNFSFLNPLYPDWMKLSREAGRSARRVRVRGFV